MGQYVPKTTDPEFRVFSNHLQCPTPPENSNSPESQAFGISALLTTPAILLGIPARKWVRRLPWGANKQGKCTSWVAEHAESQKDLGEMIPGTKQYQPWQQLSSKRLLHVITRKSPPRNYPLSPNNMNTNPVHLSHQCIPFLLTTRHSVVSETAGGARRKGVNIPVTRVSHHPFLD